MSTTVATIPAPTPAPVVEWDKEIKGAEMLLKSGLLPDTIRKPEAAMFIILVGRDLGLSPVQSLRSISVIKGKVEVAADQQLGLFHKGGGKSHFEKLTDTEAVLRLSASWLIADHLETFTMKDAERAGLLAAQPNYKKFPRAMLRSRAITAGLKSIGFDPTAGVYDYGEVGGPVPEIVSEIPAQPAKPKPTEEQHPKHPERPKPETKPVETKTPSAEPGLTKDNKPVVGIVTPDAFKGAQAAAAKATEERRQVAKAPDAQPMPEQPGLTLEPPAQPPTLTLETTTEPVNDDDDQVSDEQANEITTLFRSRGFKTWAVVKKFLENHIGREDYSTVGEYRKLRLELRAMPEVTQREPAKV